MRTTAPGGGASPTRLTTAVGRPASESSSARRGAWSDARTIRAPSSRQASTASTSRPARPGGRTGSRQPNGSPEDSPPRASEASSGGTDSQVSSSVRDGDQPALPLARPEIARRPVCRQLARLDELGSPLVGLAPQELRRFGEIARLVEHEQRAGVDVVEAGGRRQVGGPDLGCVPDGHGAGLVRCDRGSRGAGCRSARGRRPAAPGVAGPCAPAARGCPPRRRPAAGTPRRAAGRPFRQDRPCAGRSGRTRAASRARRRRTRSGWAGPATAGRGRRSRRAGRTRRGRPPP